MKRAIGYIMLLIALACLAAGCLREIDPQVPGGKSPLLSVRPRVFNATREEIATKAKEDTLPNIYKGDEVIARDELRENFFGSLDIFVKRQSDGPGTAWFKEYHLNAGDAGVVIDQTKYDNESLLDQAKQALASNWAEQGYVPDTPYDIYVTANNPHTAAGVAPANLTALKALTTTSDDIFRYYLTYTPSQEDRIYYTNCMYSEKKNFLMDGKIEGWTIDPSTSEQVFDVDLKRAAAKVLMTVKFSDKKTLAMISETTTSQPVADTLKDANGRVVYGSIKEYMQFVGRAAGEPRIKPVNFSLTASDVAYDGDTVPSTESLLVIDGNYSTFKEGDSQNNTDNTFALVTYTYPVDWSTDGSRTPYILLSVFYTRESDGDQLRSYYRIPVCDESVTTALERNNIYIVDVEIASLGASNASFEAQDEELRIEYHVIPWTETNMTQEATTVKISDTKYLTIIPTEYTLKGDDEQSVDLQWFASVSTDDRRIVDIDENSLRVSYINYQSNVVDIKGTVTKQVRNDGGTLVTATDANTDGKHDIVVTSTAPNGTTAKGETVKITLTPHGIIKIDSEALRSRAIKDITFNVYLKNASGVDPVTITIRHFPLDNIQSFTGLWSSRWDGGYSSATVREYSFNPAADGWTTWDGYENNIECTRAEYNAAGEGKSTQVLYDGTPSDHDSGDYRYNYTSGQTGSTVQTQYRNNVAQGVDRYNTNGEANAALGADGYWYWGDTSVTGTNTNYDWRGSNGTSTNGTRYRWTNYYRSQYKKTHYYARRYYRDVTNDVATTGSWVDWENKTGTTVSQGIFGAKIYDANQCKFITYNNGNYGIGNSAGATLTNNHMYVVQITSTSNKYALGRPVLDSNYQSQDKVVSPAFMIASQLGAVTNTNSPATAATHCGTYMEVGEDGTRFVGWRLPTKQEVEVIIDYQSGTNTHNVTMVEVLTGAYYWSLDGTPANVPSGTQGTATNAYVRCVRDLTLAEVEQLNNRTSF